MRGYSSEIMALNQSALSIVIPVLFLILIELVAIGRDTPVKSRNMYTSASETIDYGDMPFFSFAKSVSDFLPTFGRWTVGMGRFGLLHLTTSAYIAVVITYLTITVFETGYTWIWVAIAGFGLFWTHLPVFEVREYDEMAERNIRPRSADFHVIMSILAVLLILFLIRILRIGWIPTEIGTAVAILLFVRYRLYMTGLFGELVVREVVALRGGEEDVPPAEEVIDPETG